MSDLPGSGAGKGFSHFPGSIPRAAHCRRLQARIQACLFVLSALPSSRASAAGAGADSPALPAGLSRALVAGEAEPVPASLLDPVTHCAHPSLCRAHRNRLSDELSHENAHPGRNIGDQSAAIPNCLFAPFKFYVGFIFFSAIKVFGLVLYRMSVCLFRSQRSQASVVLGEPCTWERQCVADTFQRLHLSVCAASFCFYVCQGPLRATMPLGRGLETPPTALSQSFWKQK